MRPPNAERRAADCTTTTLLAHHAARRYHPLPVDNDYTIDADDIATTIRSSDVVVLRFVAVGQRLLLDFRTSDTEGPLIRVVRPVSSVQERYKDLRRLRPRFPLPERIVALWWPRFARSLAASDVWDGVHARLSASGYAEAIAEASSAIEELVRLERCATVDAIVGEGYKTLWSASARRR